MQTNRIDRDGAAILIVSRVRDALIIEAREKSWKELRAVVAFPRALGAILQLAIPDEEIVPTQGQVCGVHGR